MFHKSNNADIRTHTEIGRQTDVDWQ